MSKQRAYQITRTKSFPDPVASLIQGPVWRRSDVDDWIREYRPSQPTD